MNTEYEPNGENPPSYNKIERRRTVYERLAAIWLILFLAGGILFIIVHKLGWCK